MQTLNVMMVGPRGVGKTSLLAAMYDKLQPEFLDTGCRLGPVSSTGSLLQERLAALRNLQDDFTPAPGAGVQGDAVPREYEFDLGATAAKQGSLRLVFTDVPGRYYDSSAARSEQEEVDTRLAGAVASVIAIDAPAMMELGGKYHAAVNRPEQIRDLYQRVLPHAQGSRLVILAPVRCEAYLQVRGGQSQVQELLAQVHKTYAGLLGVLGQQEFRRSSAVVITPVQTVGCLRFSRFESENGQPVPIFRKITHASPYAPKDCEQPLRYILRFLLDLHAGYLEQNTGVLPDFLPDFLKEFIRDFAGEWLKALPLPDWFDAKLARLLADDRHLQAAINKLSRNLKRTGDGFQIVQGDEFFTPR